MMCARLRLVTGDQCVKTAKTKQLIKQVKQQCTGHEQESGIDVPTNGHKVSLIPVPDSNGTVDV